MNGKTIRESITEPYRDPLGWQDDWWYDEGAEADLSEMDYIPVDDSLPSLPEEDERYEVRLADRPDGVPVYVVRRPRRRVSDTL